MLSYLYFFPAPKITNALLHENNPGFGAPSRLYNLIALIDTGLIAVTFGTPRRPGQGYCAY